MQLFFVAEVSGDARLASRVGAVLDVAPSDLVAIDPRGAQIQHERKCCPLIRAYRPTLPENL